MFIGHFGVGFGSKRGAPQISLGVLFIAAQFIDLLWPLLLLFGLEHVVISPGATRVTPLDFTDYPVSHSLLTVILWGILFGIVTRFLTRNNRSALVVALCVVSHWFLDLLVHRPDLPLALGESPKLGLGLWNFPIATFLLEGILFFGGIFLYVRKTSPKNGVGTFGLVGLVVFLLVSYVMSLNAPPPPSTVAIGWGSQLQWLFVLIAFWVDRNRSSEVF